MSSRAAFQALLLSFLCGASPAAAQCVSPAPARAPVRIVSCVLAADEVLAAAVDPRRLAGVTRAADNRALSGAAVDPAVARHSGTIEEILPLRPDLIVAADYGRPETPRFFASRGVPVARLNPGVSIAAIKENIRTIGCRAGEAEKANQLVREFERRVSALGPLPADCRRPRILYYSEGAVTAGSRTAINDAIEAAGGINAAAQAGLSGFAPIGLELVLAVHPDILIFPGWHEGRKSALAREVEQDQRWRTVPAVKEKELHTIGASRLTTLSHHLADGIEDAAALVRAWCVRRGES